MPNNKREFEALLRRLSGPAHTPAWPGAPELPAGTRVAGRYQVVRLAGRGGMGEVYEARTDAGEPVALKCLLPALSAGAREVARFAREVAVLRALVHPNIVLYHASGTLPDGRPYLVLEWLPGLSLAEHLAHHGPLDVQASLQLGYALCSALDGAHAAGVVHRDLKPSNIFVSGAGVKLTDFGIAKPLGVRGSALTTTGSVLGTPHFMAPEQVEGQREPDARSDVYGLGIVLYHALSGQLPFAGKTFAELAVNICTAAPVPLSMWRNDLPDDLLAIVAQAMAREPERRFASARALAASIRQLHTALQEGLV